MLFLQPNSWDFMLGYIFALRFGAILILGVLVVSFYVNLPPLPPPVKITQKKFVFLTSWSGCRTTRFFFSCGICFLWCFDIFASKTFVRLLISLFQNRFEKTLDWDFTIDSERISLWGMDGWIMKTGTVALVRLWIPARARTAQMSSSSIWQSCL